MEKSDLDKVRATPIVGVAERLGLKVRNNRCLCIFHDDRTPSMSLSPSRNTYRCWSCGARGDPIDLVRKHLNLSFVEACRWIANESNIILQDYKPETTITITMTKTITFPREFYEFLLRYLTILGCVAEDFLFRERRLSREVISRQGIRSINDSGHWLLFMLSKHFTEDQLREYGILRGEAGKKYSFFWTPCLLFPFYDVDGNLISIQSRYIGANMRLMTEEAQARHNEIVKRAPRFQFPQGCKPMIYNLPILRDIQPDEELWISEGISDCLAILSSGRKCIAIPSATLLTRQNKELLATVPTKNWHIAPDQDAAGERLCQALLSAANECGATLTRHQLPEGCKDFSDYWKSR